MKNVVDISCFSSGKRLEMRVFDGLKGWIRLAMQTVDSYGYGMETCAYLGVARKQRERCRESSTFREERTVPTALRGRRNERKSYNFII